MNWHCVNIRVDQMQKNYYIVPLKKFELEWFIDRNI